VPDYPTDLYTLAYVMRREGDPAIEKTIASAVDGGEYLFKLEGIDSQEFEAGLYFWNLYVYRIADLARVTVEKGTTRVIDNKDEDSTDPRSHPRKMVAAIKAALLGRATNRQLDTLSYSLDVESSATRDPLVLNQWLDIWEARLIKANRKEANRRGKPHSGTIKARL